MLRSVTLLFLALGAVLSTPALAQAVPEDPGGRLVYVFSLDALDGDKVDPGNTPFLSGALAGQEARATWYPESRSVMVAETNPNHVAMATGAFGGSSGIPGNDFRVYGEAARSACGAGDDGTTDGQLPTCLQAETFFAAAKRQAPAQTTTAAIMGKPKLARIFSGKTVDAATYDADYLWTPCEPFASENPPYCSTTGRPGDGYALDDSQVMDVVLRTATDGVPADGTTKRPNLTFVNLPSIDSTGHPLGTASGAYDEAVRAADRQLQRFVANQKALGLWERTVMFVVSDHSMDTTPTKTTLGRGFDDAGLGDAVTIVQNGSVDMVYLDNRDRSDRDDVLERLRANALAQDGVDEALYRLPNAADGGTANTLDAVHPGWRLAGERTGDLVVTHKPRGAFSDPFNPLQGNHGGPQTSDNTFAVLGGGADVVQQTVAGTRGARFDDSLVNTDSAQNVDVAPTALALLGLQPPSQNQGRVLSEAFAPGVLPQPAGSGGAGDACTVPNRFRALSVKPAGRGLRIRVARRGTGRVTVDVLRRSAGRRIVNRRVARVTRSRTLRRIRGGNGVYEVRARAGADVRRVVLRRSGGGFRVLRGYQRRPSCGAVRAATLNAPVFGGRRGRPLTIRYRLAQRARVRVEVLRGGRVVRRFVASTIARTLRLEPRKLRRGAYGIRVVVGGKRVATFRASKL